MTVLTALERRIYDRCLPTRVLVLAPKLVAESTWPKEARKWDHLKSLRVQIVSGTPEARRAALAVPADIYTLCRNNLPWLAEQYLKKKSGKWSWVKDWPFDVVVIDEASSFKNPSGEWFRHMARISRSGCQIIELTGTPSPRGLDDLWAQAYLLDRGERLTDGITKFRQKWMIPDKTIMVGGRPQVVSYRATEASYKEVMDRMSDIAVSLKAEDWLRMPKRIDNVISVELPEDVKRAYRKMERDAVLELERGEVTAGSAATIIGKLLQMSNGRVYDEEGLSHLIHTEKHKALEAIVEGASGPVLVFYSYKHDLPLTAKTLDTPNVIDRWNAREIPVLWAHPASAGHGLNLQEGGCTVIWFGLPYNLEWYQQANARLYRQGQTSDHVFIHHLLAEGTVDEDVFRALHHKGSMQDLVLNAVRHRV